MSLLDLDELAERVRTPAARSFLREALACYRVGAYRSCVITTWIALAYDVVDKLRELALSGDAAAQAEVSLFDKIHRDRDTTAALKFERELLEMARVKFELITPIEQMDLARLFDDRNRFAHPNINQDAGAHEATAELARLHLRNAVEHVMQRVPVQGKAALGDIRSAVESPYFPKSADDAVTALEATPLKRAKLPVIKEFFLGCLSSLVMEGLNSEDFDRRVAASEACRRLHPEVVNELIKERVSGLFDKSPDKGLPYLVVLIARLPDYALRISAATRVRMKEYTKNVGTSQLGILAFAVDVPFLESEAQDRLAAVSVGELKTAAQQTGRAASNPFVRRAIELYEQSSSWENANSLASVIVESMISKLNAADGLRLLLAGRNPEVRESFRYPPLVSKLLEHGYVTKQEVSKAIKEHKLTALEDLVASAIDDDDPF
ncbi:hypothetical protein [Lysobacter humi (ex Lee et al. 2017)]